MAAAGLLAGFRHPTLMAASGALAVQNLRACNATGGDEHRNATIRDPSNLHQAANGAAVDWVVDSLEPGRLGAPS
ncbi:hypothetical protein ASPCADRAFT_10464 [Aspergillus carbonarius ITEM 5010]|uniref:Uncharacterized protein n=1 Tax=Aspergillus carbonarius (strain ITEM 5010) TaxID=602072 RepID=A0A1R3R8B5_ASPC5|nr:hypothetical protein ASPCADRAFT_10464 [Aspergillus carbonarius ITEM 5010]